MSMRGSVATAPSWDFAAATQLIAMVGVNCPIVEVLAASEG